jgi:ATP-dependent RNA helicase UAP56/SUB2
MKCKFFVIDECDKVLENAKMRADIQDVFIKTPDHKQVMMFSSIIPEEIKKGRSLLK